MRYLAFRAIFNDKLPARLMILRTVLVSLIGCLCALVFATAPERKFQALVSLALTFACVAAVRQLLLRLPKSTLLKTLASSLPTAFLVVSAAFFVLPATDGSELPSDQSASLYVRMNPVHFLALETAIGMTGGPTVTIERGWQCSFLSAAAAATLPYLDDSGFGDTARAGLAACAAGSGDFDRAARELLDSTHLVRRIPGETNTIILLQAARAVELQHGADQYSRRLRQLAFLDGPHTYNSLTSRLQWLRPRGADSSI
jgi:hypothetical protein